MKIWLLTASVISLVTMMSSHPVILVLLISAESLAVSLIAAYQYTNSWFSMILFLVFMGGLMVLFIYISSLASNEKFNNNKILNLFMMAIGGVTTMILASKWEEQTKENLTSLNIKTSIMKIYSESTLYLTLSMMVYLLVTLVIAVSIISMYEGPLRALTSS